MTWNKIPTNKCSRCGAPAVWRHTDGAYACDAHKPKEPKVGIPSRCTKCNGRGVYDDGYNGWFAPPSAKCEQCDGEGFVVTPVSHRPPMALVCTVCRRSVVGQAHSVDEHGNACHRACERPVCGNGCYYEAGHSGRCSDDPAHP